MRLFGTVGSLYKLAMTNPVRKVRRAAGNDRVSLIVRPRIWFYYEPNISKEARLSARGAR